MAKIDETGAQRVALGIAPDSGVVAPISATNPLPTATIQGGVQQSVTATPADGTSNTGVNGADALAFNMLFNGTTWDRVRGDTAGMYVSSAVYWTDATANQAAGATLNGTLRAAGGVAGGIGTRFEWFVAEAFADVAGGTLYVDKSTDGGTTWRQVSSIALVAGTSVSLRVPISAASYRARHVNGANATGAFLLTSAFGT